MAINSFNLIKIEYLLIEVQSGNSGGISVSAETQQERGFREEEAQRTPLRKRPLGRQINNVYNSS